MDNSRRSTGVSIGGASLLMLFAVLCMTVFAVLSYVTAGSEVQLAEKSAAAVTAYYEADAKACDTLNALLRGESVEGVTPVTNLWGTFYEFTVDIDDSQALLVRANTDEFGRLTVECWSVVPTLPWEAAPNAELWSGS